MNINELITGQKYSKIVYKSNSQTIEYINCQIRRNAKGVAISYEKLQEVDSGNNIIGGNNNESKYELRITESTLPSFTFHE